MTARLSLGSFSCAASAKSPISTIRCLLTATLSSSRVPPQTFLGTVMMRLVRRAKVDLDSTCAPLHPRLRGSRQNQPAAVQSCSTIIPQAGMVAMGRTLEAQRLTWWLMSGDDPPTAAHPLREPRSRTTIPGLVVAGASTWNNLTNLQFRGCCLTTLQQPHALLFPTK